MSSRAKRSKTGGASGGAAVKAPAGGSHHSDSHHAKGHDHHAEHHHGPYNLRDFDVDPVHHTRSHDAGEGTSELPSRSSKGSATGGARQKKGQNKQKGKSADSSEGEEDTMNQETGEGIATEAVHAGTKRTARGAAKKGQSGPTSGSARGRGKGNASAAEDQDAPTTGQETGEAAGASLSDAQAIAPEPKVVPADGTGEHTGGISGDAPQVPSGTIGEGQGQSLLQAMGASDTAPMHTVDKPFTQLRSAGQALPESGELTGASGAGGAGEGLASPEEQAAAHAVTAAVADDATGAGMMSTATGAINMPEATGTAGLLRRVLYIIRGNPNPEAKTVGDLLPAVAARYSVPPANVSFCLPGTMTPLQPDTLLSGLTTEFVALITEKSGSTREWVFWFDRGGQEAGITPAAYACSMTPEQVLSGALPSVLDAPPTLAGEIMSSSADPATTAASTMPPDPSMAASTLSSADAGGSVLESLAAPSTSAGSGGQMGDAQ